MRVIAFSRLREFASEHPEVKASLFRWHAVMKGVTFATLGEVQAAFPKAKVLNAERVRFEVAGGNYRLIVAFDLERQIAYVKFLGTHAQYDAVDALTVSWF